MFSQQQLPYEEVDDLLLITLAAFGYALRVDLVTGGLLAASVVRSAAAPVARQHRSLTRQQQR